MRLYNIYYLCKISIKGLKSLEFKSIPERSGEKSIETWTQVCDSFKILEQIPFLKNDVKNAYSSIPSFIADEKRPIVSNNQKDRLIKCNSILINRVEAIIDLYESMDIGESKEGIDIKIPSKCSFKEYISYLEDIDFIFSKCPLIVNSSEQLQFKNVDVGSNWLSFFIIGSMGKHIILDTLSKISEIVIRYKSNLLVLHQQEESLSAMKLKNEVASEIFNVWKDMKKETYDKMFIELNSECDTNITDPEERDKMEHCFDKLAVLFDKGVELYTAIETPSEVKVQFPFTENAPVIPEGLIKLLEDKKPDDSSK